MFQLSRRWYALIWLLVSFTSGLTFIFVLPALAEPISDSVGDIQAHRSLTLTEERSLEPTGSIASQLASGIVNISNSTASSERPCLASDGFDIPHFVWQENGETLFKRLDDTITRNISNSPSNPSTVPSVAIAVDGTIHVVWKEDPPGSTAPDIYYSYSTNGGQTWSSPFNVTDSLVNESDYPNIAIATDGVIHIVWSTRALPSPYYPSHVYHRSVNNGVWSSTTDISGVVSGWGMHPVIMAGTNGEIHVVWSWQVGTGLFNYISGEVYYRRWNGSSWVDLTQLSDGTNKSLKPAITMDGSGTIHVAWHHSYSSDPGLPYGEMEYRYQLVGGSWSNIEQATDGQGGAWIDPDLAVATDGTVFLVWQHFLSLAYAQRSSSGWSLPIILALPETLPGTDKPCKMAPGANNDIHLTFEAVVNGNRDIFYTQLENLPILLNSMAYSDTPSCRVSSAASAQETVMGVNTHSGGVSVHYEDGLNLPVAGGALATQLHYNSGGIGRYDLDSIGGGWTHNYASRLHIGTDTIELQDAGGNLLPFLYDSTTDTYSAYAGVTANLVRMDGPNPEDTQYIVTWFQQHQMTFNADGLLVEDQDSFGNLITFTYSDGKLQRVAQGSRFLDYTYHATTGHLIEISDNLNRTMNLAYDTAGNLIGVSNPLALTTTYTYSGTTSFLREVIDPSGRTVQRMEYDSEGRVDQVWNEASNPTPVLEINYDLPGTHVVTYTNVVMTHTYDARNTLVSTTYACTDGTASCQTGSEVGYDGNFKTESVVDAHNQPTTLVWNEGGSSLEQVTDALGNDTFMEYDSYNNLTHTQNARTYNTFYTYNHPAFPTFRTSMTDELGNTTLYTPTIAGIDGPVGGLLKATRDPNHIVTTYRYNEFGQATEMVQAAGTMDAITTTYGYDVVGRLITTTQTSSAESHTTLNVYNDGDQLMATIMNWTGSNPTNWQNDCQIPPASADENVCTHYGYDEAGRPISTTNALGQTNLTFYNSAGQVVTHVVNYNGTTPFNLLCTDFSNPDPEYNICSLTAYDESGRAVTSTNSLGHQTVTEYNTLGRVSRTVVNWQDGVYDETFPDQDIITGYEYDAVGNAILATDALGRKTRTFYDELNRVEGTITNWLNDITLANCYDGSLPEIRDENVCTRYRYDEVGNTIIVTDTLGRMTHTFYDELNRVQVIVASWQEGFTPAQCVYAPNNNQAQNICTLYGYDAGGRQTTVTNALNQTSLTVYDKNNRPVVQVTNWDKTTPILPDGTGCANTQANPVAIQNLCTFTGYDSLGRRESTTDVMGLVITFAYDGLGRVMTTTRTADDETFITVTRYDALGNRLSQTDEEGHQTVYTYDSLNRLETMASPEGVVVTQIYNAAGWLMATTNNLGHQTTYTYDKLGRRQMVTDPENHTTQYIYDALGNQVAMIDAAGVQTTYVYDGLNRLEQVMENDVVGNVPTHETDVLTQYVYDAIGNRVVITNALGFTSSLTTYDDLNRPIVVEDALGNRTLTAYNALGYQVVMTDGNEAVTMYSYDALNRLTSAVYLVDSETVSYRYDAIGNRTVMTDSVGVTQYMYDGFYRLITVTNPFSGTIGYGYDRVGNRTHLTYPDGKEVTYTYDEDNRLIQVDDWDEGITTYEYDIVSRLVTTTLPNGGVTINHYDDADRLTGLNQINETTGDFVAQYLYQLDEVGNRIVVTETLMPPVTTTNWIAYNKILAKDGAADDDFGEGVAIDGGVAVVGAPGDDSSKGAVYVFVLKENVWSQQVKLTAGDDQAGDGFGRSVAIHGNTIVVGAEGDDDNGSLSGAAYVFTWNGTIWTQQAKLLPNDGAADDHFGNSVAVYGNTAVVSARWDDGPGTFSAGSVYVFNRVGTVWSQQAKLVRPTDDGNISNQFGNSVAIDSNTILIGAERDFIDQVPGFSAGSAYVFVWNGSSWIYQQRLNSLDIAQSDRFGSSVAISGDTAVIGARLDNDQGSDSGSAYIFVRSGTTWTQQAKLLPSDGAANELFGNSVSIRGGIAVVGAFWDSEAGSGFGSAYIFRRDGTAWVQQSELTAPDGAQFDLFGVSVALNGTTVVVGAYGDDDKGAESGSAYIFEIPVDGWNQEAKLTASDGALSDSFGVAVAIDGERLVVGSPQDDDRGASSGSAYIFVNTGTFGQQAKLVPADGASNDQFGTGVAISGDTVVVGAPYDDDRGSDSGSVYIFAWNGSIWVQQAKLTASDGAASDNFGRSVAMSGDTLVVGAYQDDDRGNNAGAAYIFVRNGTTWIQQAKLTAGDGAAGDNLGYSVGIYQDSVILSAHLDDDVAPNAGSAYIFVRNGTSWTQQARLTAGDGATTDTFGRSVAIEGDTVAIGAYQDDDRGTNSGSVYVFARHGGNWTQQAKLVASDGAANDNLGYTVAIHQNMVVAGAYQDGDKGAGAGSAYIFTRYAGNWIEQAKLLSLDGVSGDQFGYSVAADDTRIVVGAIFDDDKGTNSGSVYVYASPLQTTVITHDYDPLYRLTETNYTGDLSAGYQYQYDAVGNMTFYTETVGITVTRVQRYFNAASQLIDSFDYEDGTTSFIYDNNGNLIQQTPPGNQAVTYYQYNQRNLLFKIIRGSGDVYLLYYYDGAGNRLMVDNVADAEVTVYTNDILGLSQVLVADDGTVQTYNLFGLDLISQDDGTNTRYLLADGLGSVRTEMVGDTVETVTTYEPFGRAIAQTGTSGTVYGFTGEQEDATTELVYLRARYYHPALKIFLSRDPFPGFASNPATQHPYTYVRNNPVNLIDPTGELCFGKWSIGWSGCTDEQIRQWDESVAALRQLVTSPEFVTGFIQEFTNSMAGGLPLDGVLRLTEWLFQNTNLGLNLQIFHRELAALCGVSPNSGAFTPYSNIVHNPDPRFQAGRATGRLIAYLVGVGEIAGGDLGIVVSVLGSPSGISLAAIPVAGQVAAHGTIVVGGVIAREAQDGLIGRLPALLAAAMDITGGGGNSDGNNGEEGNSTSNTPNRLPGTPPPPGGRGFTTQNTTWLQSAETGGLRGHMAKHCDGVFIPCTVKGYFQSAIDTINKGNLVPYRHSGQIKNAYIRPAGNNMYYFTATTTNGRNIFTHYLVEKKDLLKMGITFKGG